MKFSLASVVFAVLAISQLAVAAPFVPANQEEAKSIAYLAYVASVLTKAYTVLTEHALAIAEAVGEEVDSTLWLGPVS